MARARARLDKHPPEAVKGILVNPIYTGACAKLIEEEGAQQFLVNLLHVLRECFQEESSP